MEAKGLILLLQSHFLIFWITVTKFISSSLLGKAISQNIRLLASNNDHVIIQWSSWKLSPNFIVDPVHPSWHKDLDKEPQGSTWPPNSPDHQSNWPVMGWDWTMDRAGDPAPHISQILYCQYPGPRYRRAPSEVPCSGRSELSIREANTVLGRWF